MVKANQSNKIRIELSQAALDAFEKIKILLQEQIELFQPDYNKPFELTTDASNFALGAVLSQNKHPIIFISRTLTETEQNYATNLKEILAIVWALQKLRNYLYGVANLTIYTDHQSLIYSISEKNPNTKLKRWKNFIAEFGAEIKYQPGHQNVVVDALSRHYINSSTIDDIDEIKRVFVPLNRFKIQLEIEKSDHNSVVSETTFTGYQNHKIKFTNEYELIHNMGIFVSNKHVNAIYSTEDTFHSNRQFISNAFPDVEFVFTTLKVENVVDPDKQLRIVSEIHQRAHRNIINNLKEACRQYFWLKMKGDFLKYAKNCEICKTQKYERIPMKQPIGATPIPTAVGESISMDIFFIDKNMYVTSVDRVSKYLIIHPIQSKLNFHEKLE